MGACAEAEHVEACTCRSSRFKSRVLRSRLDRRFASSRGVTTCNKMH